MLGDAFTWVGIALLAYQFGGTNSAAILSIALTLKSNSIYNFWPLWRGTCRQNRQEENSLYNPFCTHGNSGMFTFCNQSMANLCPHFLSKYFPCFFYPAYQAAIPQAIKDKKNFSSGIALSNATNQLLGVLGPGLAGGAAAWLGARQIFFVDAASFIIAAVFILTLPSLLIIKKEEENIMQTKVWTDVLKGTRLLFTNPAIRFALLIELISAIAGAQILVNTVGYVKGQLHLTDKYYGYTMAAFGIGAAIAAFASGNFDRSKNRISSLMIGGGLICVCVAFGNYVGFIPLLILWLIAGFAQTLAEMPSQILIAEKIPKRRTW